MRHGDLGSRGGAVAPAERSEPPSQACRTRMAGIRIPVTQPARDRILCVVPRCIGDRSCAHQGLAGRRRSRENLAKRPRLEPTCPGKFTGNGAARLVEFAIRRWRRVTAHRAPRCPMPANLGISRRPPSGNSRTPGSRPPVRRRRQLKNAGARACRPAAGRSGAEPRGSRGRAARRSPRAAPRVSPGSSPAARATADPGACGARSADCC